MDFHADGRMTRAFEGWIRLAEVQTPGDREILDFHAPAVLVDWQLELEADGLIKSLGLLIVSMVGDHHWCFTTMVSWYFQFGTAVVSCNPIIYLSLFVIPVFGMCGTQWKKN